MKAKILKRKAIFGTMRTLASILVLFVIFSTAFGQDDFSESKAERNTIDYGLSPSGNLSFFGNSDTYNSTLGLGCGFFFNPYLSNPTYQLASQLGFKLFNYQIPKEGLKVYTTNFALDLGLKLQFPGLDNSSLVLKSSTYYVAGGVSTFQGLQRLGPRGVIFSNKLKNRISQGMYIGFDFDLKEKSSLELGYTHIFNQRNEVEYIDAVPHNISLSYNINFSEFVKTRSDLSYAKETVAKLSKDTLYFINQSCDDELPNVQLDSILKANYSFSKYRVLNDEEVARTRLQTNVVHYAVIGSYYPAEGEPLSSGIFLLDKDLIHTDVPYPHFKRLEFDLGINKKLCIGTLDNAVYLIQWLNTELSNF